MKNLEKLLKQKQTLLNQLTDLNKQIFIENFKIVPKNL